MAERPTNHAELKRIKLTDIYIKNKPFFNSILTGFLYFLFCWSIDFEDLTKGLFISLMFFLPGLTFPLTTCYYKTENIKYSNFQQIIHLVLSVGIYFGSVWLFSVEGKMKCITILAGLAGSLFFQLLTKFQLKKEISLKQIIFTSILSGLAFLPYELIGRRGILIGIAVFLWTIINGQLLNYEYKKATYR